jgi:hypothetical protein
MNRLALTLSLGLAAGCGSSGGGSGGTTGSTSLQPTLSSIQQVIFTPSCAVGGCHNTADQASAGLLTLQSGASFASLINIPSYEVSPKLYPDGGGVQQGTGVQENLCSASTTLAATVPKLVVPGDPANSYLIWKLTGKDATGAAIENDTACSIMPKLSGLSVTTEQITAIQTWIQNGALNN